MVSRWWLAAGGRLRLCARCSWPLQRPSHRRGPIDCCMAFSYYNRLNRKAKRIYDRSDAVHTIRLNAPAKLLPLVHNLKDALGTEEQRRTLLATRTLLSALNEDLRTPPVKVKVLAARPHAHWGELHGLYIGRDGRKRAEITVWMRTAKRRQVVAFRTFLRTILHEWCHHLDFELLALEESFHTEGFYKRESSIFHQLVEKPSK